MKKEVIELFGAAADPRARKNWTEIVREAHCPYLDRKCIKVRKSQPDVSIGTCSVRYRQDDLAVIICPFRLLEREQIFTDCLHLLTLHEPGNELHVVSEITIPGGSVDYFLVSAKAGKVKDFVGIELQTLDTTGTVWPARQRFLHEAGISVPARERTSTKPFGMNWKMTAKTTLVQLHHKIETFENLNKHLVLVLQDHLLRYMRSEFSFEHLVSARLGDPMHFHAYALRNASGSFHLDLAERVSTNTEGIATCLGLQVSAKVGLEEIIALLESRLSERTLLTIRR